MSLTCAHDVGYGDYAWYYTSPNDYTNFVSARRKRCCSCNILIKKDALALKFTRTRPAKDDIEEHIYGDDGEAVPMAAWWMCESCGDIFFNLEELGFCPSPSDSMSELLKEYKRDYSHGKK